MIGLEGDYGGGVDFFLFLFVFEGVFFVRVLGYFVIGGGNLSFFLWVEFVIFFLKKVLWFGFGKVGCFVELVVNYFKVCLVKWDDVYYYNVSIILGFGWVLGFGFK